jgi:GT2 family glycosyltransferase
VKRFAVIPTHDRFDDFFDCLNAIAPQVDQVFMIDHNSGYGVQTEKVTLIRYDEDPPNISRMWNLGLEEAAQRTTSLDYYVAVLNDDAIVPPTWFDEVLDGMQDFGSTLGCAARGYDHRPAGYAFILAGGSGLRADEQFRWWYGDDDLHRRALELGGVCQVPGIDVEHRYPNSTTYGILRLIAHEDEKRFKRKWE